jgi:pyruvate kinase
VRKTKIIATLGPASSTPQVIQQLIEAGADVMRINASHANHAAIAELTEQVHRLGRLMERPVAVLLDLAGPKVRLGAIEEFEVAEGDAISLTGHEELADPSEGLLPCNHAGIANDVEVGQRVLIDDGLLAFEVLGIDEGTVRLRALRDGVLKPRKGINLPDSVVSIPALTDKDRADLAVGVDAGVDFVALSFVQRAQDVVDLKDELVRLHAPGIPIIAKIEKPRAVENLDSILKVAEGVMVARGDLGVEAGAHRVAVLQKEILQRCHRVGAVDIVATQMLDSMERNPTPTRAEANDVGNSILDGVDGVMLSGETASGKYPAEAVAMMARIAEEVEGAGFSMHSHLADWQATGFPQATAEVSQAAARIARHPRYEGILVLTASGRTARVVTAFYPRTPIYAFTPSAQAYRRLALLRGVVPMHMKFTGNSAEILHQGEHLLLERGMLREGDHVVAVAGTLENPGAAHMVKVLQIGRGHRPVEDAVPP